MTDEKRTSPGPDYDTPWKQVIERYFKEFTAFFFPEVHAAIDWSREHEFLDKELSQVDPESEIGRRLVDKLVKVWQKNGEEAWVLVHIEVQGQEETGFPKRMYIYNYRIFDRFDRKVASLAVLTDARHNWRPDRFGYKLLGSETSLIFPIVKLIDYRSRQDALEESRNPFAVVVLAHLKTLETASEPHKRFKWKFNLVRMLYERGYSREDVTALYRFIDWVMFLPDDLEEDFRRTVYAYEEEKKMPYISSIERVGIEKGVQLRSREAVIEILETRFKTVPHSVISAVEKTDDTSVLKTLFHEAITVKSINEFIKILNKITTQKDHQSTF